MKKVLLGIFGLGLLAVCGFEIFRRRKACNTMEAVWVSTIPVDEGKEEKSVTEMTNDVDQAISEMDIEDELAEVIGKVDKTVTEELGKSPEDILKEVKVVNGENAMDWIDRCVKKGLGIPVVELDHKKMTGEDILEAQEKWEAEQKKIQEEKLNADIQKAVERKDFTDMFLLFDKKYSHGPVGITACEAFGCARRDGLITDEIYQAAYERNKRIWNYTGD